MRTSPQVSRRNHFLPLIISIVLAISGLTNPALAQTSQLVCSPCAMNFGNVAVGGSQALPVTFSNPGTSAITISGRDRNAPWSFSPKGLPLPYTLHPGQTATFNMVFAPPSDRQASGSFTFHSNASNAALVLSVSGTGVAAGTLAANPSNLGFGWVPVSASRTKTLTVTNPGNSAVTITQVANSGSSQSNPFSASGITTPLALAPGQSITFDVTFAPTNQGDAFGNLSLSTSTGGQISVAENGFGSPAGSLSVNPASVNFGNVTVGSSQSQTITLSATSSQVTVSSGSVGSSEYSLSGLTLPVTLAAGQSLPVTVTFTPQASGAANTNLAFTTGTGNNNSVLTALLGTGVAQVQHSVALSWQPPSSQVVGYNVYRGSQSGGPYAKITSSADGSTSFADTNVQAGNSYFYEVTSVDGSGMESVPSSPVAATVPSP